MKNCRLIADECWNIGAACDDCPDMRANILFAERLQLEFNVPIDENNRLVFNGN